MSCGVGHRCVLDPSLAVALVQAGSSSSSQTPSLQTSICRGSGPRKGKKAKRQKKKKKKNALLKETPQLSALSRSAEQRSPAQQDPITGQCKYIKTEPSAQFRPFLLQSFPGRQVRPLLKGIAAQLLPLLEEPIKILLRLGVINKREAANLGQHSVRSHNFRNVCLPRNRNLESENGVYTGSELRRQCRLEERRMADHSHLGLKSWGPTCSKVAPNS